MPNPSSPEKKAEGETYNFEDRPNREALVEQRKKYIKQAIVRFFNTPVLVQKAQEPRLAYSGDIGDPTRNDTILDIIAEEVMAELKNRQGINEQSKDKTIEEFERAYPTQIIKQEILQDPRVSSRKDDEMMYIEIRGMGGYGFPLERLKL